VKGLVSKKHRHTFDKLLEEFNRIGYTVSWKVLNAWDYGVAQKRERVFIVGVRNGLDFSFVFPEPEPGDYRTKVLRDVIRDLPDPCPYYYRHPRNYNRRAVFSIDEPSPAVRTVNRPMPDNYTPHPADAHVQNHEPKELTEKQLAFLERNPASVTKNRPVTMDEPSWTIPAVMHKGVPYGLFYPNHDRLPVSAFRSYKFDASNRGAKWGEPSVTLRANTVSGQPWHPDKYEVGMVPRRFTVRECLRIQSAPDWYVLPDDISLSAQYRIVGNGVPCRVAWYLGRALADQLKEVRR